MDNGDLKRCPHYQLYSEALGLDGPPAFLAVRRCMLTERLIKLLRQSEEGDALADKLVVHVTNGRAYAFVGPDLDAVTQRSCSVTRCQKRCTPSYIQHLDQFGIVDPKGDEITCDEQTLDEEEETSPATYV